MIIVFARNPNAFAQLWSLPQDNRSNRARLLNEHISPAIKLCHDIFALFALHPAVNLVVHSSDNVFMCRQFFAEKQQQILITYLVDRYFFRYVFIHVNGRTSFDSRLNIHCIIHASYRNHIQFLSSLHNVEVTGKQMLYFEKDAFFRHNLVRVIYMLCRISFRTSYKLD